MFGFLRRGSVETDKVRRLTLNNFASNAHHGYCSNILTTTKYTAINLVPKAVFEQFRRISNFYFLLIAAVSFIPDISPSTPITNVLPLIVVVGFGLARDVFEDLRRRVGDRKANTAPRMMLRRDPSASTSHRQTDIDKFVVQVRTQDLHVGDVVKVAKGETFPADLVLVQSADEAGICYVSTANLDGESNLKRVVIPPPLADFQSAEDLTTMKGEVTFQAPDPNLYKFEGSITVNGAPPAPLDTSNLLLRGSVLRNTESIFGLIVYTGFDTKVALNMRNPPSKFSQLERKLNYIVLMIFLFQASNILVASILAAVLQARSIEGHVYLGEDETTRGAGETFARSLGTFFILFGTYIPVSLFVTLEFVHIIQGMFMGWDRKMTARGISVTARSTNLNELLGSIHHIFSDKTGTLTENVMQYVASSANGEVLDTRKEADIMRRRAVDMEQEPVRTMVRSMAICHAVVPDIESTDSAGEAGHVREYQGQSPDEVALVSSARDFGVELIDRRLEELVLDEFGERKTYTMLAELEFNSDRKRMSMIVREPDGTIRLYCKGADNIMVPLMKPTPLLESLERDVHLFATEGLRTLVFANRTLSKEVFEEWHKRFLDARNSLEDRADRIAEVSAEIEVELEYVCCTAVEDKLQEEVPETIDFMRRAGIRLWVLTGDKRETAENIGYSSKLLDTNMEVLHVKADSTEHLSQVLADTSKKFDISIHHPEEMGLFRRATRSLGSVLGLLENEEPSLAKSKAFAVIIDGPSLAHALADLPEEFLSVTDRCKTVICCRVTPLQKALVVRLVKEMRKANSLSIGDGGNDVSMIQEADVGVGVYGKEGSQAVRAADYALAEFRFLKRLMVVHGRYADVRTAGLINLSFYKNFVFTLQQFFFQFFDFFTGTTVHHQWFVTFYNLAITLLPPFAYALYERDLRESTLEEFPEAYSFNRDKNHFGFRSLAEYGLGYALWHALVVFFAARWVIGYFPMYTDGSDGGFQLFSVGLTTCVVLVVLFKFLISSRQLTSVMIVSLLISYLAHFTVPLVISRTVGPELTGIQSMLYSAVPFWALVGVVVVMAYLLDFTVLMIRKLYSHNVTLDLKEYEDNTSKTCCFGVCGAEFKYVYDVE